MDTQYKSLNTQFKIWNTQISQKEVGKYPIASNPYLELWCLLRCLPIEEQLQTDHLQCKQMFI